MKPNIDSLSVKTIRFLAADMVQRANSGHPGLPMGAASLAYVIWMRHLRHNPQNPAWHDRDRFILSGGHGSALLYSLLYLTGYDVGMDDLQNFRQWGSRTPGHPERGLTPGVETTTGPLGQGFTNGVGMAIAEAHLAAIFNHPGHAVVDHYIYGIVTDGDLMEGVSSEAASLAGHLRLGKIIYLYDDNRITIDGPTELTFTEDRALRFESYGWHVLTIGDGNDLDAIDKAIVIAKRDPRPSLICCRTHIGFGLPNKQDTAKAHGEPPGLEELEKAKVAADWPVDRFFYVPDDVLMHFRDSIRKGVEIEEEWRVRFSRYRAQYPALADEFSRRMDRRLPENWSSTLTQFQADQKGMATRAASGEVLSKLALEIPELMGGSADLSPSNNSKMEGRTAFQANNLSGTYLHFGVREHGMGGIVNGVALHGGLRPFGATFLVFSDYMRGAIRVGALSRVPSIWVFTHDSIGVGEDGPTHQPVEHLAALRAIPGLVVIRPCDANETVDAWKIAIERTQGPTALILTRQAVPTLDRSRFMSSDHVRYGAYILSDLGSGKPDIAMMASGSEVGLVVKAGEQLSESGVNVRLISFPSWELFELQDQKYKESVLPSWLDHRIAVEAGVTQGWHRWVGQKGVVIGIDVYGASAPGKILYEKYGLTVDQIISQARKILGR